jgi:ubiquitin carboxyl-terminal hydrolase 34
MVMTLQRPETFAFVAEAECRSLYSYCGLKNQGATCYMNSMLQQIFMIPSFKYLLLSADDNKEEDLKSDSVETSLYYGKEFDDNLLHQYQNAMGFLELTERPSYNALGLCYAMKDYSGNPTNCSLQQDCHEFVNLSFDRLENMLKETTQKYLVADIFSAKQCTHILCSGCKHVKTKIEDYYILSLPVKNLKNLSESFDAYTGGEIISDFRCDHCDQKVDINKKSSFAEMPNILMIHLQKIVLNFNTFQNEKIADRFEFPTYLNIKDYSVKNMTEKYNIVDPEIEDYIKNEDESNFEYRLIGVIIHQGIADAGHYYSLICTDTKK